MKITKDWLLGRTDEQKARKAEAYGELREQRDELRRSGPGAVGALVVLFGGPALYVLVWVTLGGMWSWAEAAVATIVWWAAAGIAVFAYRVVKAVDRTGNGG